MVAIFTGLGSGVVRSSATALGSAGVIGTGTVGRGSDKISVNAATGNLLVAGDDEFLVGKGLDIGIARTYNSFAETTDRDNNDNWQQSTTQRVFGLAGTLGAAGSSIKRLDAEGSVVTYTWGTRDGIAGYWATDGSGSHDRLTSSGANWIWTDGDSQVTETYGVSVGNASEWRLIERKDLDGNKLTFAYLAGTDSLDRVTTADGSWVSYVWSGSTITRIETGFTDLATATAKTLTRTWYDYTGGRLSQVRVDLTPDDNASPTAAQSYWTQYLYDGSGRITQILQKDGSQVNVTYDGSGRVSTLTQQVATGDTRVTALAYGANYTNVTGPDGQVTRLDYDGNKQLTKVTAPPAYAGAAAQIVQFAYDIDGNLASVTDASGKATSYVYDARGNVTKITDPNLNTVERWYDGGNRITMERTYGSYKAAADVAQYTRFAYDVEGHLRYSISREGQVTEYRYTAAGQLQSTIEYPEHSYAVGSVILDEATMDAWRNAITDRSSTKITVFSYDARGNRTVALNYGYANADGSVSTAEGYSRVYTTYDQAGRLLSRNAQGEVAESFIYDGLGRLTASTDVNGGTTTFVFNDAALTTTITTAAGYTKVQTFNKAGEMISVAGSGAFDVSGTGSFKYDKNGRLRVSIDETGYKTFFIYDSAGQLVGKANAYGHLVEYRRDASGRVIAEARYANGMSAANLAALENPDNGLAMSAMRPAAHSYDLWSWTVYDSAGRVIQKIDGDGGVAAFEYDKSDRLVKTVSYVNKVAVAALKTAPPTTPVAVTASAADSVSRSFYDRSGKLVGSLDGLGYLTEIVYDAAGQKIEEVAYITQTNSAYWASGTFNQLRSTAAVNNANNRRMRYVYDGQGQLRYSVDSANQVAGFTYNVAGKLLKSTAYSLAIAPADYTYDAVKAAVVANANDRATTRTYDSAGRVATETSAVGTVTTYTYDTSGRVIKAQVGSGAGARITRNYYTAGGLLRFSVDAEGYVRRFDYDAAGRNTRVVTWDNPISVDDTHTIANVNSLATGTWADVRTEYDLEGRVAATIDGEGNSTVRTYYATGQLRAIYAGFGSNDLSTTYYVYDGAGRLKNEYAAYGESEQAMVSFAYDGLGNMTSQTDARGKVTQYSYDVLGQVVSVTDAAGGTASKQYNAFGEVVQTVDSLGGVTTNTYNKLGQVTRTNDAASVNTDYTYNEFGEMLTVVRAGATTSFEYDKLGRVTRSTDALGNYEAYTYDAWGNRATMRNKLGGTTTYAYDRRGLLVSETLPVGSYNSAGTLVASAVVNTYSYDARGNRRQMVEASGLAEQRVTSFTYDKANQLIQTTGQTFLGMTPVTTYAYDGRGNLTRTTDPAGARTVYFYDDIGRVTASIDPVGTYTATTFDANGNVSSVRVYETAVGVPADGGSQEEAPAAPAGAFRETTYTYDNVNRMIGSSVAGVKTGSFNGTSWVSATSAITTAFEYDAAGNVVKTTDANGNTTWSYYDVAGRKIAQVDGEGYRTDWTYNADGNVLSERRYWNRAAAPTGTSTPPAVTADAAQDRITNFTYDLNGNRLSEARTGVQVHNGSGGYSTVTATVSYLYNGLGQVTRKTEASGDQVNYTYDAGGRLTVEARAAFVDQTGASVTPTVDYYYDGVGNLSRTRQRGSGDSAERVTQYGYDGGMLRWLANSEVWDGDDKNGQLIYYWYDAAGRQTHEYASRYDSAGNLTKSVNGVASPYEGTLTGYDLAGRVIQKYQATYNDTEGWLANGPAVTTSYNAFGEVAAVAIGGVTQQSNQYDAMGRVIATNGGDGVWKFFGYDKNGNQTIAIASAGANLSGKTFDQAFALIGQSDVNPTFTRYDKRNMALNVTETGRQLAVGGAAQTLSTSRVYNAFGEVASETNALGATIDYSYNTMGRLIKSESPMVAITLENGTVTNVRPTEQYYYDAAGRLVATRDANNNLTRLTLLAGSGYGGSQALVTSEIHADGGVKSTKYDIHGDAREMVDELGYRTLSTYDKLGRVTVQQEMRNAATTGDDLYNYFAYNGLGQQLKHWNNFHQTEVYGEPVWVEDPYYYDPYDPYYYPPETYGHWEYPVIGYTPDVETADYDIQGRVTSTRTFGGDVTTVSYAWDATIATSGLGTFGGWTKTTTMANGKTSVEKSDSYGRVTYKSDLGGHVTGYTYDVAGRISQSTLGGISTSYTWLNAGFLGKLTIGSTNAGTYGETWTRDSANYTYDKVGNRLSENLLKEAGEVTPLWWNQYDYVWEGGEYYETSTLVKSQTATYDALGRMRTWAEAGSYTSPAASISQEYDAAGNVRRTLTSYRTLDANGTASSSASSTDMWFRYDSMNRVVTNQGQLVNGVITRGAAYGGVGGGQDITYDVKGQRTSVTVTNSYYDQYSTYTSDTKELYTYDEAGRLIETRQLDGTGATGTGVRRSLYSYDLIGRQISQSDYNAAGNQVVFSRSASYNMKSQLQSDYTSNLKTDNKTYTSSTSYNYGAGTGYALGAVLSQSSSNGVSGSSTTYSSTTNTYVWYDGALQNTISYKPNTSQSTTYTTSFGYDGMGRLTSAYIADGKPHSVTFTNDELGQVIRRDETAVSGQTGAPHEVWYRYGGRQLGYTGNNGTNDMSMAASISDRQVVSPTNQGTFRNKQMYGSSYADFAQNYDPINSFYQGSSGGSYTVQKGDTLQGIAQNLWGDSSLWYKIAEANGLGASSGLIEGTRLILPTGVVRNTNNAGNTKPYDPSETIGDLAPTTSPKPPKKGKCGGFGMILLAVIAIAVTAIIAPQLIGVAANAVTGAAATGLTATLGATGAAIVGGGLAAAAGSIVSQAIGVATGIQSKFSWKAVGMAAIGGAVGGALQGIDVFSNLGKATNFANDFARGALGSSLTQGIGVATGLQEKFSWAGVAAAGLGTAIGGVVGRAVNGKSAFGQTLNKGDFGYTLATTAAGGIANAATRSAIEGSSFGKNLIAALPEILGQAVGGAIAQAVLRAIEKPLEQVSSDPVSEKSVTAGETAAEAIIASLPPERVAQIAALGGKLVAMPDGRVRVDGLNSSSLASAIGSTEDGSPVIRTGKDSADGIIRADANGLAFVDTTKAAWQDASVGPDLGGNNYEFAPGFGSVASFWFAEGGGGAVRILANDTSAFLWTGGTEVFPELGIRVSYGPRLTENALASYFTGPIADSGRLSGWERAGAGTMAVLHGLGTVLSGAGAVATSELCATGIGCVVPIALGAGAVFEADNFQMQLRRAWTGREADTLGSTAISTVFNVSPQRANQIYGTIQLSTAVIGGVGSYRALTTGFAVSESGAVNSLVRGGIDRGAATSYVASFDGPISMKLAGGPGQSLLRYTDDAASPGGSFLTNTRFSSPDEAVRALYLSPYGNNATLVQSVTNPIPRPVLTGGILNGQPGVSQFVIRRNDGWVFATPRGY